MTEEEEFSARSHSNGRGKATQHGYCSIADGEWGVWYLIRTIRHVAINQIEWPKRHGQPVLVQR